MINDKYKLTDDTKNLADGTTVFRIQALKDFNDVEKGELGGYIESEENLSFEDDDLSWVYDDSVLYGTTRLEVNSIAYKGAVIKDSHVLNQSRVAYDSNILNSLVQGSQVQSSTLTDTECFSSTIGQSTAKDSEIVFSNIGDTRLNDTFIESSTTTYDSSIQHSHIEDQTLRNVRLKNEDTRLQLDTKDLEALALGNEPTL